MVKSFAVIFIMSFAASVFSFYLVILIFRKVFQNDYKRPWMFVGFSTVFFLIANMMRFFDALFPDLLVSTVILSGVSYVLDFIAIIVLAYGLLLEYLILEYYKGKFVKVKFIPVQEGSLTGDLDIDVTMGNGYLALKKDRNFMLEQFADAAKKGFEGFLISELTPREIRSKYDIQKTPLAWIRIMEDGINKDALRSEIDENSDVVDPLQLNNLMSFVDNFLEQSTKPFLMVELNLIFKTNNETIVMEFMRYVTLKIKRYNGIIIFLINTDSVSGEEINDMKSFLVEM